jgi:hypothetical protein
LNEQANSKRLSEDIIGGIHLLNRLLPPIMETSEISQKFFWSEENAIPRGELLCSTLISLFFKEGFTINNNSEGKFIKEYRICSMAYRDAI